MHWYVKTTEALYGLLSETKDGKKIKMRTDINSTDIRRWVVVRRNTRKMVLKVIKKLDHVNSQYMSGLYCNASVADEELYVIMSDLYRNEGFKSIDERVVTLDREYNAAIEENHGNFTIINKSISVKYNQLIVNYCDEIVSLIDCIPSYLEDLF